MAVKAKKTKTEESEKLETEVPETPAEDEPEEIETEEEDEPEVEEENDPEKEEEDEPEPPKTKKKTKPKVITKIVYDLPPDLKEALESVKDRNKREEEEALAEFEKLPEPIKKLAPGDPKTKAGRKAVLNWLPKAKEMAPMFEKPKETPKGNTSPKAHVKPSDTVSDLLAQAKKERFYNKL